MTNKIPKIGIIGDGQLARMLVMAAQEMGLKPWVLGRIDSPTGLICKQVIADEELFFQNVETILFESEFIDVAALKKAAKNGEFFPRTSCN